MFADSRERGARIPFYDVDVEQGLAQLARLKSDEWLCLSFARPVESDFAMVYRGRAMGDSIPPPKRSFCSSASTPKRLFPAKNMRL